MRSLFLKCAVQRQQSEKGEGASLFVVRRKVGEGESYTIGSSHSLHGLYKVLLSRPHNRPCTVHSENLKHSLVEVLRLVSEHVMARASNHLDGETSEHPPTHTHARTHAHTHRCTRTHTRTRTNKYIAVSCVQIRT